MWFYRYANEQTDRHKNKHAECQTRSSQYFAPYRDEVVIVNYRYQLEKVVSSDVKEC